MEHGEEGLQDLHELILQRGPLVLVYPEQVQVRRGVSCVDSSGTEQPSVQKASWTSPADRASYAARLAT